MWLNYASYGKDRHPAAKGWLVIEKTHFVEGTYIIRNGASFYAMNKNEFEANYKLQEE